MSQAPSKSTAGKGSSVAKKSSTNPAAEPVEVNLHNAPLAAVLAWLIPGAGHFYQGRYAKGALFLVCILGTYIFGLVLGEGKVVHTGGTPNMVLGTTVGKLVQRWPFLPQAFVGAPAIVAVYQHMRVSRREEPLFGGWFAPPRSVRDLGVSERSGDELAFWNARLNQRYDIGMLYTMVAGLLNVLAIYDAFAGPVIAEEEPDDDDDDKAKDKSKSNDEPRNGV